MHTAAPARIDPTQARQEPLATPARITRREGPSLSPTEHEARLSSGAPSVSGSSPGMNVRRTGQSPASAQQVERRDAVMGKVRKVCTLEAFEQALHDIGELDARFHGEAVYALGCRIVHLQEPGVAEDVDAPGEQRIAELHLFDAVLQHLPAAGRDPLCRELVSQMQDFRGLACRLREVDDLAGFRVALLGDPADSEVRAVCHYERPLLRNELLVLAGPCVPRMDSNERLPALQLLREAGLALGGGLGADLRDMLQNLPLALQVVDALESACTWEDCTAVLGHEENRQGSGRATIASLRADLRAVVVRAAIYDFRLMSTIGPVDWPTELVAWARLETAASDVALLGHDKTLGEDCDRNFQAALGSRQQLMHEETIDVDAGVGHPRR